MTLASCRPRAVIIRLVHNACFITTKTRLIRCQLLSLLLNCALLLQLVSPVATGSPTELLKSSLAKRAQLNSNTKFSSGLLAAGTGGWSRPISGIAGGAEVLPATITDAVVSRHKPTLNSGRIEGTLRVLLGESFAINRSTHFTSDLYLPGTPTIHLSGGAQYGGTVSDGGAGDQSNYTVSLTGGINFRGLIHTNVEAIQLPADFPNSLPSPTGARSVTIDSQSDVAGIGNWQAVRDLNVKGSHLSLDVPPGNYRTFTVNGNSHLNFSAGTYNFSNTFNLDGGATLRGTGLVTINVGQNLTVNSGAVVLGSYTSPGDVHLNVLGSSLNVNGSSQVSGLIRVYNGTVTLNGSSQIRGQVIANSLTLNGGQIIGAVWPVQAGSGLNVFGARRFDRTAGAPNQYLEQFALPAGVTSPYTLHIQNGEPDGSKRISRATVKLNGVEVLAPNDLNQNVGGLDRTIVLTSKNQLDVRLESEPGSYLIIYIAGIVPGSDTTAPTISITYPADHSSTIATQTTVSGTAADVGPGASGMAHVYVNNSDAAYNSSDGTWTISNVALALGDNQLSVRVVDQAGNEATASITVTRESPTNQPPTVGAGLDQTLTLPQTASLQGTATDDGLPESSNLTTTWTIISGPGTVTFADEGALNTTASFNSAGTYVLRLTASDGDLSTSDDLTVTLQPQNQPPTVSGGPDQTMALPHTATLNGMVSDDGLPESSTLSIEWSQVSGPGTVTFADPTLAETTAACGIPGTYVIRLTASDTELTTQSDVTITVQPENQAPTVNAGLDQTISLPASAQLNGAAADDAWPANNILSVSWSLISGPGPVSFDNSNVPVTIVSFVVAGTYVLRLSGSDGELSSSDEISITVTPPNQAPSVNAGLDQTIPLPSNTADLNGEISDDGLPLNSSVLTDWSKVSGPGSVAFANPNVAVTSVAFGEAGTYVLRLSASDLELAASDEITVTVLPENHAPTVNAGADQSITLPNTANLDGSNSDDGLPAGSSISTTWTKVSGPGTVTFASFNTTVTAAAFSEPGIYVLRLTASDSQLNSSDDLQVIVIPENHRPTVEAGGDQTITLPNNANLSATVNDDGLPAGGSLTTTWSKLSGPGDVTFSNSNEAVTSANFGIAGAYLLRLTASDSQLTGSDEVMVVVNQNHAPTTNAGPDQTITLPNTASLNGNVSDDGLPEGSTLTSTWSKVSGPGTVTFANGNAAITTASFSQAGSYILRLAATDSQLNGSDDVQVNVNPPNQPPTVNAGVDQTITLPWIANLQGTATDDGAPAGSVLTLSWSLVSGPAGVSFANPQLPATTAAFMQAGTYTLRLTVSDSEFTRFDDVTIVADTNFCATLAPGLIAWWAGDNNANDLANGHHGLLRGGATFANAVVNQGFKLDGVDDYVEIPDSADFKPANVTVDTWVKFDDLNSQVINASQGQQYIVFKKNTRSGAFEGYTLYKFRQNGVDKIGFAVASSAGVQASVTSQTSVVAGQFYHLAGTYDRNRVKLYVNGVLEAEQPATFALDHGTRPVFLGTTGETNWDGKLNGVIDEADVFSRALSASEIQEIYLAGSVGKCKTPVNHPPSVYAGPEQTIMLPSVANLQASVSDDGRPANTLAVSWSKVSGPGAVTFANANLASTTASVCQPGTYVFRLTASDGEFGSSSNVMVTFGWHSTITLTSGNGLVGTRDSSNQFTTDNGNTFQDAYIVAPQIVDGAPQFSYSLISGTQYISRNMDGSGPDQTITRYRTQFVLPSDFNNSSLSVSVHADNAAAIYLNGTLIGQQTNVETGDNYRDPAEIFGTNNSILFQPGVNTLDFDVHNFFGPTGLDYKAVVSYSGSIPASEVLLQDNFDSENCGIGISNYTALANWNVAAGAVDLKGNGYADVQPGHGLYLDMDGSTNQAGTLDSKQTLTLSQGCYTLSFEIGNYSIENLNTMTVSLDNIYSEQFTISANDPFARITRHLSVTATTSSKLKFAHSGGDGLGLLLDNVYLIKNSDSLCVITNLAPSAYAGPDQNLTLPTITATLNGNVSDDGLPSGSSVTAAWSKVSGPGAVTFGNSNAAATTGSFATAGVYVLRLTVSDSELSASDELSISITPPNQAPTVNAGADQTVLLSQGAQLNGSSSDDGLPGGSTLRTNWTKVSGPGSVTFLNPNVTVTGAQFSATGTYVLRLTASDGQLSASDELTITVIDNVAPPSVEITAPTDGSSITEPALVTGSVSGGAWVLEYSLASDDNANNRLWTTFATGNGSVTNSSLGMLDPTLMLNGLFDLRLSATDSYGQTSRITLTVIVERNLKVGNFTVSFSDLNIPVAGVPMNVTRSYDSRNKRVADFGFGWTLGVMNVRLEKARAIGLKWYETKSDEAFPNYCLEASASHLVTVTFAGGKVFKFEASTSPQCQRFAPISGGTLTFTALPGTHGTLEVVGSSEFQVEGSIPGPVNLVGFGGGVNLFNSTLFKFTAEDGTAFVIDQRLGLQSIQDTNNNTVRLSAGGIVHSGGKSITFNRDVFGRISSVIDPAGNAQTYTYDAAGDLVTYTDSENNTSTYSYDATHRLLTIQDPRGIQPIRNDYDADGRLISHTDGFGKVIRYTHDLPGRTETITDRLGNSTIFLYDERGNVLTSTDARAGVTTFTYDANDNLLTETNALGKTTTYTYDASDHRSSITDPLSNVTQFTYNGLGKLLTTTDPLGHVTTNTYNGSGNLLTTTDALNNITTFSYSPFDGQRILTTDALNNSTHYDYTNGYLTKETDALGHETTFSYDANGNRASQTVKRTNAQNQLESITTSYEYDKLNRLKKTTFSDGTFTQVEYNSIGQQSATIDQLSQRTEFTYDDMGRLTRTDYADATYEETTYDEEGRRLVSKDRAGQVTSYQYDELGRLKKTTFPDNTFTSTTYDDMGQVLILTDARGNVTHYEYDNAGRRTKIRNALNQESTFVYDVNGNQLSMTDPLSHTTTYEYDSNKRRIKTIFSDSSFDTVDYDALGRSESRTDQAGKRTQFTYDALGRLTKVKDALNHETSYDYNEIGQQISQTDANNHTTRFEYDQLGRRVKRILPAGQLETYSYDDGGNLRTRTNFNGHSTTFNYDLMRRLLSKVPDASLNQPTISFTYNSIGQRATMSDASGATVYRYDVRNRLSSKQTPFGTLSYTYDEAGNLLTTRSSNANGVRVDYSYDRLNRLASVKDNNLIALNGGVTAYSYDTVGNLQEYSYPNGITSSYVYNSLNRLTTMTVGTTGSSLASYAYTLGATGNRTAATELSGRTVNYTYDDLYGLTGEAIANDPHGVNGSVSYGYDLVGNRLSRTSTVAPIPSHSSIYDANDRLDSDSYDDNGNTTAANGNNYAYDFENHLTSLNGATVSYVYDGDGNRVAKTVGGVTTNYLVDTNNPTGYAQVVEELQAGAVVKSYTYGNDLISQRIVGASLSFYCYDGHGSVRLLTDATAAITDTYDYDAFGNLISRTGMTPNDYLYSGEQFDLNLGFYYLRARYLNPSNGRFWSMDSYEGGSYDPGSLHKYSYTRNSPTNLIDPSGQFSLVDTLNTSVLVGTVSGFTIGALTGGLEGAVNGAIQGSVIGALMPLTGAGVGTFLLGNAARGVFITGWGVGLGNAATSGFSFATATSEEERTSAGINLLTTAGFMYFGPKILQRVNTKFLSAEQANIGSATRGYSEPPWSAGLTVTETTLFAAAKYVRVYSGNRLCGAYVMEASEIQGLTAVQIKEKFALPFLPDKIAIAEIPAGTTIRIGVAGPNSFAPNGGGGMQVEIQNPNHPNPPNPPTRFTP